MWCLAGSSRSGNGGDRDSSGSGSDMGGHMSRAIRGCAERGGAMRRRSVGCAVEGTDSAAMRCCAMWVSWAWGASFPWYLWIGADGYEGCMGIL